MAALTADLIVDRVRSICSRPPFRFIEAVDWTTFELQPSQNAEAVFRIPPPHSQHVRGGFSYMEDRTDGMQIWVMRMVNQNTDAIRRALLTDMHSLTAAVVRDAHQDSGDYNIPDGGRGHTVVYEDGKDSMALRVSFPIQYETQL